MPDKRKEGGTSSSLAVSGDKNSGAPSLAKKAKTTQPGADGAFESLTYDPVHFIRSHSKNNDPADIQTQVGAVQLRGENFGLRVLYTLCVNLM